MNTFSARLESGAKLRESIYELAKKHNIRAGIVLTCLGSLHTLNIRLAGADEVYSQKSSYEILSLSGTFNNLEEGHFHISVADNKGNCIGGHLLSDNIIATTAEIVLASLQGERFLREKDKKTGYLELQIKDDLLR